MDENKEQQCVTIYKLNYYYIFVQLMKLEQNNTLLGA